MGSRRVVHVPFSALVSARVEDRRFVVRVDVTVQFQGCGS